MGFPKEEGKRYASCKNCGEPIVWTKNRNDKNIPADPGSLTDDQWNDAPAIRFERGTNVCHWDTCTEQPEEYRNRRRA